MDNFVNGMWFGFIISIVFYNIYKKNLSKNAVIVNMDNLFDLGAIRTRYQIKLYNTDIKNSLEEYMKANYHKANVLLAAVLKCLSYQSCGYKMFYYSADCESLRAHAVNLLNICGLNQGKLIMQCKHARFLIPRLKKYNIIDII